MAKSSYGFDGGGDAGGLILRLIAMSFIWNHAPENETDSNQKV
jgi:hypothetical protein